MLALAVLGQKGKSLHLQVQYGAIGSTMLEAASFERYILCVAFT
jgi:hypothetical protein